VPFVNCPRQSESNYTLAGEAYLHGFMHGEMLDGPRFVDGFGPIYIL
jgi:hypothetical protein